VHAAAGQIDIAPTQRQQLGDPQAGKQGGSDRGQLAWRAACQQRGDLLLAEDLRRAARRVRALVVLKL
jgi:hypothetical protein